MNKIQVYYCTGKCSDKHDHKNPWVTIRKARAQPLDDFKTIVLGEMLPFIDQAIRVYQENLDLIQYCEVDS